MHGFALQSGEAAEKNSLEIVFFSVKFQDLSLIAFCRF